MFDHVIDQSFHTVLSGDYRHDDLIAAVDNAIAAYNTDTHNPDLPLHVVDRRMAHINDAYDFLDMGDKANCIKSLKLFWSV